MGGYRLGKYRQPTFFYSFNGIKVEDYPAPVESAGAVTFKRTLSIEGPKGAAKLWFRAASGQVEAQPGGSFKVNGNLVLSFGLSPGSKVVVRDSAGKQELLVSVGLENGKARIEEEISW